MTGSFDFDFDFDGQSRGELLAQATKVYRGLTSNLGVDDGSALATSRAAEELLGDLGKEVAEFSSFPEILPLKAEHFELHGMTPPLRFTDLSRDHRFYWVRFPITLRPLDNRPFVKLQCAVEFNPGVEAGHLRPVAQLILPDSKFQKLFDANTRLTLAIGEDFEFKASADATAGGLGAGAKATVDAKAAAGLGFAAGPFEYTLRRAKIQHSPTGTEKVFWTLDGAEFFEEQEPVLVIVLRVPNEVNVVRVAAALQASHEFNIFAAPLGAALSFLGERIRGFFRAGAPAQHTQVWDLTPRL